jgi:hypothetical protein
MTPEEKAKELVFNFRQYCVTTVSINQYQSEYTLKYAKQCALIAVDEIIKQLTPIEKAPNNKSAFLYWEEVKQEIEKL